jgi:hypothetical protein
MLLINSYKIFQVEIGGIHDDLQEIIVNTEIGSNWLTILIAVSNFSHRCHTARYFEEMTFAALSSLYSQ